MQNLYKLQPHFPILSSQSLGPIFNWQVAGVHSAGAGDHIALQSKVLPHAAENPKCCVPLAAASTGAYGYIVCNHSSFQSVCCDYTQQIHCSLPPELQCEKGWLPLIKRDIYRTALNGIYCNSANVKSFKILSQILCTITPHQSRTPSPAETLTFQGAARIHQRPLAPN